jgi:hypothetical protein
VSAVPPDGEPEIDVELTRGVEVVTLGVQALLDRTVHLHVVRMGHVEEVGAIAREQALGRERLPRELTIVETREVDDDLSRREDTGQTDFGGRDHEVVRQRREAIQPIPVRARPSRARVL